MIRSVYHTITAILGWVNGHQNRPEINRKIATGSQVFRHSREGGNLGTVRPQGLPLGPAAWAFQPPEERARSAASFTTVGTRETVG
jgi:hypothetical protein